MLESARAALFAASDELLKALAEVDDPAVQDLAQAIAALSAYLRRACDRPEAEVDATVFKAFETLTGTLSMNDNVEVRRVGFVLDYVAQALLVFVRNTRPMKKGF